MTKSSWKKLIVIPLLLSVAVAPLCAQNSNGQPEQPAQPDAPASPTAPAAPDRSGSVTSTNNQMRNDDDHPPVRIDMRGIHVGGPNPVDIGMGGGARVGGEKSLEYLRDILVTTTAIVTPFFFLALVIGLIIYYKNRRNRILHETIRAMIEKGVPIPPELLGAKFNPAQMAQNADVFKQVFKTQPTNDLRNGLVLL